MTRIATRSITLAFALFCSMPLLAFADGLHQVVPRAIEATVQPGDVLARTVTISNKYPHRINVYPSVHGLRLDEEATSTSEVLARADSVFGDWTTITHAAQTLDAGESITLPVRFVIDRETEPGTYYGLLGFGQGISRPVAEHSVEQGVAPTVVLRFTVPTPQIDESSAFSLQVLPVVFDAGQQVVQYTVYNPTRKAVIPAGEILFFNQRGGEVVAVPINVDRQKLQPGDLYQGQESVSSALTLGSYRVDARVSFGNDQLAALVMSDSFVFIPWPWLLVCIVLLLIIGTLLYRYFYRRYKHAATTTSGEAALPLHVYTGTSPAEDHDINLKQ